MIQRIEIIGNVVADAEVKKTSDDREFVSFRVAVNDNSSSEERKATFYEVLMTKTGVYPYLVKGKLVYVSGKPTFNATKKDDKVYTNIIVHAREVDLLGGRDQ